MNRKKFLRNRSQEVDTHGVKRYRVGWPNIGREQRTVMSWVGLATDISRIDEIKPGKRQKPVDEVLGSFLMAAIALAFSSKAIIWPAGTSG